MYFPQIPIEIRDFLRNVDSYSDEQKLCIVENFVRQLKACLSQSRLQAIVKLYHKSS